MPSLFEADDVTPRTAPHGSISILDSFPTFPTNNVWVEVHPPNFHQLIQEWVNDPSYLEGDPIGVTISPANTTQVGRIRSWDDFELVVEHRPRNVYVVT